MNRREMLGGSAALIVVSGTAYAVTTASLQPEPPVMLDTSEAGMLALYRSRPPEVQAAFVRAVQRAATGMDMREVGVLFHVECGYSREAAEAGTAAALRRLPQGGAL